MIAAGDLSERLINTHGQGPQEPLHARDENDCILRWNLSEKHPHLFFPALFGAVRRGEMGLRPLIVFGLLLLWPGPCLVQADLMLPPGERITDLPVVARGIPQKEPYEAYDPPSGRNFDIKNFWMRGDLRVRPEWRRGICFGGGPPVGGVCNRLGSDGSGTSANPGRAPAERFVQQWARVGIGYDLSPDVNFYLEIIDSANWGDSGGSQPACSRVTIGQCRLGIRAGYVLIRNVAGIGKLSVKAGRQYLVFGNQRLFGHFDWSNTGYSHDGVMLQYAGSVVESYAGWFRSAETDLGEAAPGADGNGQVDGNADADSGCGTTRSNRSPDSSSNPITSCIGTIFTM
jgi:hypothetical protein